MRAASLMAAVAVAMLLGGCSTIAPTTAPWAKQIPDTKTMSQDEQKTAIKDMSDAQATHKAEAEKSIERR